MQDHTHVHNHRPIACGHSLAAARTITLSGDTIGKLAEAIEVDRADLVARFAETITQKLDELGDEVARIKIQARLAMGLAMGNGISTANGDGGVTLDANTLQQLAETLNVALDKLNAVTLIDKILDRVAALGGERDARGRILNSTGQRRRAAIRPSATRCARRDLAQGNVMTDCPTPNKAAAPDPPTSGEPDGCCGCTCGNCSFDMSKSLDIDIQEWECAYGGDCPNNPEGQNGGDRYKGTLQPTETCGVWESSEVDWYDLDTTFPECDEANWGDPEDQVKYSVRWNCSQNRWEKAFGQLASEGSVSWSPLHADGNCGGLDTSGEQCDGGGGSSTWWDETIAEAA